MTVRYGVVLDGDATAVTVEAAKAAASLRLLGSAADQVAREEAAATAAGDRFVQGLQRQLAAAGKTESELLQLRAAELGVAEAARPLIDQLSQAAAAQDEQTEAARRAAAGQKALDNIRSAGQAEQQRAFRTQQQFIDGLQRETNAIGKTRSELLTLRAAELGVTEQAIPLIQRLQASEKALGGFGKGGKLTAQELTQVSFQLNDLAVQVASGQNPLIALVQQGSQLSGTFGGVGNAVRALGTLVTPFALGVTAVGVALGLVAFAYTKGYKEQAAFERGLLLTGNRAGVTRGQFDQMAASIEASTRASIGAAREALQAAISSGEFTRESVGEAARAAAELAEITGDAVDSIVRDLGGRLRNGVAAGAADLNRQYGFLSVAQFQYIRELEAGGRVEEARAETLRLLGDTLGKRTPTELGLLDAALRATKKTWSEFWDAAFDIGRPETIEQRIAKAARAAEEAQDQVRRATELRGKVASGGKRQSTLQQEADDAQASLDAALETQRLLNRFNSQESAKREAVQLEIDRRSQFYVDREIDRERALIQQKLGIGDLGRAQELNAVERQYQALEISTGESISRRAAIEQRGVDDRLAALDAEIALEKRRVPESTGTRAQQEAAEIARKTKLIELEGRRSSILQESVQIESRRDAELLELRRSTIAAGLDVERAGYALGQAGLEQANAAELAAVEQAYAQRELTDEQYFLRRAELEKQSLQRRVDAVAKEIELEQRRPLAPGAEAAAQREQRLLALQREQIQAQGDLQRAEDARRQNALQGARELADTNRALGVGLIRDARERGQALIDIEEQELRKRLDLAALNAEQRKKAEANIADYVVLRQRQLTEELKPEWQRMVDGWRDTQQLMRQASDDFQTDFLRTSRQTFIQFASTGRASLKDFGKLIQERVAGNLFDRTVGPALGELSPGLASLLGFGRGTPRSEEGKALAQRSNTLALQDSTLALNGFTVALGGNVRKTGELDDGLDDVLGACTSFGKGLDGLGGSLLQAARAALSLAGVGGGSGGGGFLSGLVNAVVGAFSGGAAATTSAVYSPQVPAGGTPLSLLSDGGGRARGGPVGRGRFYEVMEGDAPEVYESGGRKYLLNPGGGRVTPAMPLSRGERQAVGGVQVVNNVKIENAPQGAQVSQRRNDSGGTDTLIRFKDQIINELTGDVRSGNGPMTAALASIGVGRSAALRP